MKKLKFKIIEKDNLYYLLCKRVGIYGFIMDYWRCVVNCKEIFNFLGTDFALNYSQMKHLAYKNINELEEDKKNFIEYVNVSENYYKIFTNLYNKPRYILFTLVNLLPNTNISIESLKSIIIFLLVGVVLILLIIN